MKASVGDRLILASSVVDGAVRDGRVVEVRHEDGSPPYTVEWSDSGERTLVFPGPDARVQHVGEEAPTAPAPQPVSTWRVQITVDHAGPETTADAVLVGEEAVRLDAVGRARLDPHDPPVAIIGDEVAVARALRRLADRLIGTAEQQIEETTGRPAHVRT